MNFRVLGILIPSVAFLSGWATVPVSAQEDSSGSTDETAAILEKIDEQTEIVSSRVGMPVLMELSSALEDDFVEKGIASGRIIDVTLEEVEAALQAAAQTEGVEDDIAAQLLKHRGSYRFILPE